MEQRIPWARVVTEGVIIVLSILLAFGIDAWWDGNRERARLVELERALEVDLRESLRVAEFSIRRADSLYAASRAFLDATADPSAVPIDSLQGLFDAALNPIGFSPSTPAVGAAMTNGDVARLENPDLSLGLLGFQSGMDVFQQLMQRHFDLVLEGPLRELADEVGSLYVLSGPGRNGTAPERFQLSPEAYRRFVVQPRVYARVETAAVIQNNQRAQLRGIRSALQHALDALGEESD